MQSVHLFVVASLVAAGATASSHITKITRPESARVVDVTNSTEWFVGEVPVAAGNSSGPLEYRTVTSDLVATVGMEKLPGLEWLVNLYNPHMLEQALALSRLHPGCTTDMHMYLKALDDGSSWAAKMSDSTGRATQFFFGNDFWLGSESLCLELADPKLNSVIPPYPVQFSVAKLSVGLPADLTTKRRTILLGICMPKSCSADDITAVLTSRAHLGVNGTSLSVLNIKFVPGQYSVFRDIRFQGLGGCLLVMIALLAIGTTYDHVYERRLMQRKSMDVANRSDLENNNEKSAVDMKLAAVKTDGEPVKQDARKTDTVAAEKSLFTEFLLSFSVTSNGSKILNCDAASEDSLTSVHGMRFFSLTWVIMVHTYLELFAIGENKTFRAVTERSFMYQTIGNATYSVDSFFFISGLLVAYLFFKNEGQRKSDRDGNLGTIFSKFLTLIGYRFIRLTPVYGVVLCMIQISMMYIHNVTVFEPTILDHVNCDNYWWRNILYLNNMFPRTQMCMLWSWYMATDTQFFVLSALLLLFAKKRFKFTAAATLFVLLSSWCTTAIVSYSNSYEAKVEEPFALFDELYDKPWTRIGPYLVGMFAGWLLYKTNCKITMSTSVVVLGWASSCACLLSLVYGLGSGLSVPLSAVYVALGHTAWGASLAWIVIACRCGYGGFINTLLSYPGLYPLSRLTYCAYLVHPLIMFLTSFVMDGPFHIHNGIVVIVFLGNLVASFLLSFLLSITFEAPVVRLLKLLMTPKKKK